MQEITCLTAALAFEGNIEYICCVGVEDQNIDFS